MEDVDGAAVTTGDWRSPKAVKAGMVTTGEKAMCPFMYDGN